ncbi:MAG TPA: NfeD family protein [Pyrinomonadaceae bacterium]|jgi:membrane protein implicated in regulation of membrane protease activity
MLNSLECFSYSSLIPPPSSFLSSLISHPPSLFTLLLFLCAVFVFACLVFAAWLHHRKGAGGALRLEGRVARVLNPLEPEGAVLLDGELWRARARSGARIECGRVRIVGARGHWLEVEPVA